MSPNLANDLAAQTTTPGLPVGEDALGRGNNCYAETTLDAGKAIGFAIDPVTWSRDSSQP